MRRPARIVWVSAAAMIVLLVVIFGVGMFVAQSDWLRNYARARIIAEAEKTTGGKVEIGAFQFDWQTLTAAVDHFVIHGTEPQGSAPLLAIDRLTVGFKIISLFREEFDIASVSAMHPRAHLIVNAAGKTNIPEPKLARDQLGRSNLLDLKIRVLEAKNGWILSEFPDRLPVRTPWSVQAGDVTANLVYDAKAPRYNGALSTGLSHVSWSGHAPVAIQLSARGGFERNRLTLDTATLTSGDSQAVLRNAVLADFVHPVITGQYAAHVALHELYPHQSGTVSLEGSARYVSETDYQASGKLQGAGLSYRDASIAIRDVHVQAMVDARPDIVHLKDIKAGAPGLSVVGEAELKDLDRFEIKGRLDHLSLHTAATSVTHRTVPFDGIISGTVSASGRLDDLKRSTVLASLNIAPTGSGKPLNGFIAARYDGAAGTLQLNDSYAGTPQSRLDVSGVMGRTLNVKLFSTDVSDLLAFLPADANQPRLQARLENGSIAFSGTVEGPLANPGLSGHVDIHNAVYNGQNVDSAAADLNATSSRLALAGAQIVYRNVQVRGAGSLGLNQWRPTDASRIDANVRIVNSDVPALMAITGGAPGGHDVQLTGVVNGTAHVTGTLADPHADADLTATKGAIYGEPYDAIKAHALYLGQGGQTIKARISAGAGAVDVDARYDHPPGNFLKGTLAFQLSGNRLPIEQFALVRAQQPGISGTAILKADGILQLSRNAKNQPEVFVTRLDADLAASALRLDGRNLGDAHLIATTRNGVVNAKIDANVAQSAIHGSGTIQLSGDYPMNGHMTFEKADLNTLARLASNQQPNNLDFEGLVEGQITATGPLRKPEQISGTLDIPHFELRPGRSAAPAVQSLVLKNAAPIHMSLSHQMIHMDDVRLEGPDTKLRLTGNAAVNRKASLGLHIDGDVNPALLKTFDPALTVSGNATVNALLRGTYANPDFSGRAELKGGEFHFAGFANALTNTNAVFVFNGTRATIQSLNAESGGGKVSATGFAALTNRLLSFTVQARARQVRVRYPEGVSTVADANLNFAGTSARGEASGLVRIRKLTINPRSDAGSILSNAAEPVKTPSAQTGLLANLNLDIQIETAPDVALQTSLAQTIQADASLRLRGTATNPALLGRITVSEGELVFFGNKYTISQGSISFFNPVKIDPVLNVDLSTKARGVDIILTVTGSLDKPLNVTYRSDPPLQFSDIVALLATGRAPTDPSLAVRATGNSQSLDNMGASALLGQAIANPVSGRLQRFFGVSKLKIDPQLSGVTGSPQARLTLEQQVTPDILFTYITDVSSTSTQLIRVEWSMNKNWSAILLREENGYVGLDFAYRKRFK